MSLSLSHERVQAMCSLGVGRTASSGSTHTFTLRKWEERIRLAARAGPVHRFDKCPAASSHKLKGSIRLSRNGLLNVSRFGTEVPFTCPLH
jgi:hypothetical protein